MLFSKMNLEGLDHIALAVRDVAASEQWYRDVLGLERKHEGRWDDVPTFVGKGATGIALFPASAPRKASGETDPTGFLHFALRANRENFERGQRELKEREIDFRFEDHGIAHSIYFRHPDGYKVEITTYELS